MKKNIKLPDTLTFWGMEINNVMKEAQKLATKEQDCEFEFNGVNVVVGYTTNLDLLLRDYYNSHLMGWETIGSHCDDTYSPELLREMADKQEQRDEENRKQHEEYERKDKLQREEFEAKVVGIEMDVSDSKVWKEYVDKNADPYGKCAVDYARDWARLMQYEISKGKSLVDIADTTSHELGFYGITGFMYGCVVSMLSTCWKHGEELRKWHNKEYNHEGDGVVNPAILTIKS